jgi:sulfate adenylyltransferase (ADP) / ATP adenylyltransferase
MSTLWDRARDRTAHALARGALEPIETELETVHDGDARFAVHLAAVLRKKGRAGSGNPFCPYDGDLYVGDAGARHVLLLNKYPVVRHHVLLVTREPEEQESLLTLADFEALFRVADDSALVFYNAGAIAGASQRHKHLQLVPLPLDAGPEPTPLEPQIRAGALPFVFARADRPNDPAAAHQRYLDLLAQVGCDHPPAPYNLLVTARWMLIAPRTRERFESIAVNALGFAGSLIVRDHDELARVREIGPMAILKYVTS